MGKRRLAFVCALALSCGPLPAFAQALPPLQAEPQSPTPQAQTLPAEDADTGLLRLTAEYGIRQIALAQLAMQASTNPRVVEYARQIILFHTGIHGSLSELASQKGVTLPQSPNTIASEARTSLLELNGRLSALNGMRFDEAYLDATGGDHRAFVEACERLGAAGNDFKIKAFTTSNKIKVQTQIAQASALARTVVPTAAKTAPRK
ncbi:DUF4142 domain-containing protein [Gloeobacter morelensis]|uniref:DUF4142 domain-containing protein n=1 Tax=Gloeobacter morelensis MG652769 TaxID=2781736 RepID=A0ABY3PS40_9CYAN|nr:DUF4142 domain-containing protein [Gloeobacter morelensis]UFP96277.1 DUF4142 domain-containing protein [Gloeobacter morelensis MG652769]